MAFTALQGASKNRTPPWARVFPVRPDLWPCPQGAGVTGQQCRVRARRCAQDAVVIVSLILRYRHHLWFGDKAVEVRRGELPFSRSCSYCCTFAVPQVLMKSASTWGPSAPGNRSGGRVGWADQRRQIGSLRISSISEVNIIL